MNVFYVSFTFSNSLNHQNNHVKRILYSPFYWKGIRSTERLSNLPRLMLLLLLLSRFSHVRLCATPWMAAHQAPPSLGFSRQEHWSGLPFPSPTHESEKWKWSCSVVSDSYWPHGLRPTRFLCPWDFPDKSAGVGCRCLLRPKLIQPTNWNQNLSPGIQAPEPLLWINTLYWLQHELMYNIPLYIREKFKYQEF